MKTRNRKKERCPICFDVFNFDDYPKYLYKDCDNDYCDFTVISICKEDSDIKYWHNLNLYKSMREVFDAITFADACSK